MKKHPENIHKKNEGKPHKSPQKIKTNKPSKTLTKDTLVGPISINSKGVGFFDIPTTTKGKPDKAESFEIQPENLNRAFHGDKVEVALTGEKVRGRIQAKVVKIVERVKSEFVGVIRHSDGYYLIPDDKRMYVDISLPDEKSAEASLDQKALVKITDWNNPKGPIGEIIKTIGEVGENNTEMESIVLEKGFRVEFPAKVQEEAENIKQTYLAHMPEEIKKRRDMRDVLTMTIDPRDAKDFDDAISFKDLGGEMYEIGVHIADVSYFVTPGTNLDREAEKRGLSVYLVDRTIPMLPEVLSNDLCSLNPNEDKYTFSAVFKINDKGDVLDEWFGRTVIHSDKRFTYEDAQEVIDGSRTDGEDAPFGGASERDGARLRESPAGFIAYPPEGASRQAVFEPTLRKLNQIAKELEKKKFHGGAINFETEEVKFELDEKGKPIRVYKKQRLDTHKLVEEYMLLANRAVAKFVFFSQNKEARKDLNHSEGMSDRTLQGGALGKQSVYRVHGSPDPDRIEELAIFVKALGFELKNTDGKVTSRDINNLLKQVEGTPNEELIKTATIRSMAKAIYSTKNIGHFGLAFKYYTHFTSPIRRYPDLLVHRFLERELNGGKVDQGEYEKFEHICLASSELEKRASEAERASIKYKQVEYMQNHIGEEFDGTITGVTEWGVYIEEKETKCEGMVKIRDIGGDFYTLDEKNYTIRGEKTGRKLTLGDSVRFKVVSADMERRVLDYALI